MKEIFGCPINIYEDRAPSFKNRTLKNAISEYKIYQIIPTLKYLISDDPISLSFWREANYAHLHFLWDGKEETLFTNHGLEECMRLVLKGKMNVSDIILDLSKLVGSAITDREEMLKFKAEIHEKVKKGIVKKVIP